MENLFFQCQVSNNVSFPSDPFCSVSKFPYARLFCSLAQRALVGIQVQVHAIFLSRQNMFNGNTFIFVL